MFRIACVCPIMLALFIAATPAHAQTAPATPGDDLLGLWGAEPVFGPQVHGALTLTRRGTLWTMQVAGFEAVGTQQADSVVIALPGGQGVLRIWTETGTGVPDAYWVQPEGAYPSYASPVRLQERGTDAWRGQVAPIEARLPLYLMVSRADDGTVRGTFRNPSANWPGRVFAYNLQSHDDVLSFTDPRTGETHWQQPYDAAGRTISFDFGAPVILTPRTREQAIGFVTRSPALAPYRYRSPLAARAG